MTKVVGIDLGTTNTVVAVVRGIKPEPLDSLEGRPQTRSVVSVRKSPTLGNGKAADREKREWLIGDTALDNYPVAPRDTIISIKRLMGRGFQEPEVQRARTDALYEILSPSDGTNRSVSVRLDGREMSPQQISAMILARVKEDAEYRLSDSVTHAVITVPAYFTEVQKAATREAARLAGLGVLKILEEPTAAAIAYGDMGRANGEEGSIILVYDLGGGTFDVSVIAMAGYVATTLSLDGDMWLGGDNLDQILVDYSLEKIREHYPEVNPNQTQEQDPRYNLRFMAELRKAAQRAKETLTSARSARIIVIGLLKDGQGDLIDIDLLIYREEFERMILPLIGRYRQCTCGQVNQHEAKECVRCLMPLENATEKVGKALAIVRRALQGAGVQHDEIDHVLMVGNASIVPIIQKSMEEEFGTERLRRHKHPKYCVAEGAAILAARMDPQIECDCGHANSPTADHCEKCRAFIGDLTIKCLRCGARNGQGLTLCRRCGEPLDLLVRDVSNGNGPTVASTLVQISAHNYGIQLQGDLFEVFIEKNDTYPTTEIKTVTRHTQEAGQRVICIPVYAGLDLTRASANELQGEVFAVLPPQLSADTAVQVRLWLDADGVFGIDARLANGLALKPVILRGRGDAKAVEVLLQAEQLLAYNRYQMSTMDLNQVDSYREQVLSHIDGQQFDRAVESAHRMLAEVEKYGETQEQRATHFLRLARHICEVYAWALDGAVLFTLDNQAERVEEALRIFQIVRTPSEEAILADAVNRLVRSTNALPDTIKRMAQSRWAIQNEILPFHQSAGYRMAEEIQEIMHLIQQGNTTLGNARLARLTKEIEALRPQQPGARCAACGAHINRDDPRYCINGHDRLLMK